MKGQLLSRAKDKQALYVAVFVFELKHSFFCHTNPGFFLADAQINFNFVGMRFIDNHGKAFGKDGREEPETLERV